MKLKLLLLCIIISFTTISCDKSEDQSSDDDTEITNDEETEKGFVYEFSPGEKEKAEAEARERRKHDYSKIEYQNFEGQIFPQNLNFDLQDFQSFIYQNRLKVEDFLIIRNWRLYNERVDRKDSINADDDFLTQWKKQQLIPGTTRTYRNHVNDSEISIFHNEYTNLNEIRYETVNNFNFRHIIKQLNDNMFDVESKNLLDDPRALGPRFNYIDELIIINRNIKYYDKYNFHVEVFSYQMSPVVRVFEDLSRLGGYGAEYDGNREIELHIITFEEK